MANRSMLGVKTKFIGFKELEQNLDKLPPAINKGMRESVVPVVEKFKNAAKLNLKNSIQANKDGDAIYSKGKLEKSIKSVYDIEDLKGSTGPDHSAKNKKGQTYAEWVEFGHYMTGGKKVFNADNPSKSDYSGAKWWPGYHYMTRAWQQNRKGAFKDVKVNLTEELKKYAVDARKNVKHLATDQTVGSLR